MCYLLYSKAAGQLIASEGSWARFRAMHLLVTQLHLTICQLTQKRWEDFPWCADGRIDSVRGQREDNCTWRLASKIGFCSEEGQCICSVFLTLDLLLHWCLQCFWFSEDCSVELEQYKHCQYGTKNVRVLVRDTNAMTLVCKRFSYILTSLVQFVQ